VNTMPESLEKLQNRILSDARLKAEETVKEAEAKTRQILEEARQRAQRESDEIIAKARVEAESIRRSILSSKVRVNRLRILD
jgi:vacuolar-type H+-ATPase subunit E/Vma4